MEDVIQAGRIAGIPFFDVYDFTWGEVQEYCDVVAERNRAADIRQARLLFASASAIGQMFSDRGQVDFMTQYQWLFTDEELRQARIAQLMGKLQ